MRLDPDRNSLLNTSGFMVGSRISLAGSAARRIVFPIRRDRQILGE
jgi:hypothetical protein